MNFDIIEGLSVDDINYMYESILNEENVISGCWCWTIYNTVGVNSSCAKFVSWALSTHIYSDACLIGTSSDRTTCGTLCGNLCGANTFNGTITSGTVTWCRNGFSMP